MRTFEECLKLLNDRKIKLVDDFTDEEVKELVFKKHIEIYKLESHFRNPIRGIRLRRELIETKINNQSLAEVPYETL